MRSIHLRKVWAATALFVAVAVTIGAYVLFPRHNHVSLSVIVTGVLVMLVSEFTSFTLVNRRFGFYTAVQVPFLLVLGPLPVILMQSAVVMLSLLVSHIRARASIFDPARLVASSAIPLITFMCFKGWTALNLDHGHGVTPVSIAITVACSIALHVGWAWLVPQRFALPRPAQFAMQWLFLLIPLDAIVAGTSTAQIQVSAIFPRVLAGGRIIALIVILYLLYTSYLQRMRLLKIPELLAFFTDAPNNDVKMAESLFAGVAALVPVDAIELWHRRDHARYHLAYQRDFSLGGKVRAGQTSDRPFRSGEGLIGFCASSRDVLSVMSGKQPLLFEWNENRDRYPSAMAAPILSGDEVEGVLAVYYRRLPFVYRRSDRELMRALAIHVGQLYHGLLQLEETRALMETDELTGLYNYRYFDTALHQCVRTSQESQQPVSLLILDIDHFKQINDTHGHMAGNEVLRQLANVFREMLRDDDIIARYGGEEFTILLPGLDRATARVIAERLRKRIEDMSFVIQSDLTEAAVGQPVRPVDRIIQLTVSIGIAAFPTDADSALTLIRHADRAMYMGSKQGGRNRVTAYQSSK